MTQLEKKLAIFIIENKLGTLIEGSLHRTYAGCHQKSYGAWSWFAMINPKNGRSGKLQIGSQYPLNRLMKDTAKIEIDLEWEAICIDPKLGEKL